jgi:hypothetical protein
MQLRVRIQRGWKRLSSSHTVKREDNFEVRGVQTIWKTRKQEVVL